MRLFIGLALSAAAAEDTACAAARVQALIPGRYSLPENYHLTLSFLGEVPPERLEDARHALSAFAARFPAPRITLGDLSYFKDASNAILIRTAESPDDLPAMRDTLNALLDAHSLPHTDGPFSPHVTLVRHADLTACAPSALSCGQVRFVPACAALYLSARDADNILRYTPLFAADFLPQH